MGQVEAQYKYTAFGEVAAVSIEGGAWSKEDWETLPLELSTNMLAGGRKQYYLDPETALYLLGSGNDGRYYDPATARSSAKTRHGKEEKEQASTPTPSCNVCSCGWRYRLCGATSWRARPYGVGEPRLESEPVCVRPQRSRQQARSQRA